MSTEDLRTFFARLEQDESLQARARALSGAPDGEREAGLTALAAGLGLQVTAEDLRAAAAGPAAAVLDDETLGAVAAGGACDAPGFASPDPDAMGTMGF